MVDRKCIICKRKADTEISKVSDIVVAPIDGKQSFADLLNSFVQSTSDYFCNSCGRLTDQNVTRTVRYLPKSKCIVLRLLLNVERRRMLNRIITDFKATQPVAIFGQRCVLVGAVLNHSKEVKVGHFTSMLKVVGQGWRHMDDDVQLNNGQLVKKFVSNLKDCEMLWFRKV